MLDRPLCDRPSFSVAQPFTPSLPPFPSQVRAGWSKLETARATRLEELRVAAAEAQKKMSDEQAAVRVQLEAEWAEIERQRAMQV